MQKKHGPPTLMSRELLCTVPAFFGLCAFAPLSLLPDLDGLSHRRDAWSSARLGQPEQRPTPHVASLLSGAQPPHCAMR